MEKWGRASPYALMPPCAHAPTRSALRALRMNILDPIAAFRAIHQVDRAEDHEQGDGQKSPDGEHLTGKLRGGLGDAVVFADAAHHRPRNRGGETARSADDREAKRA